jgi:hypothetical protein
LNPGTALSSSGLFPGAYPLQPGDSLKLSGTWLSECILLPLGNGTWSMVREFHTHFPMGTAFDLRKIVVLAQTNKMEKLCMKIISYPLFTN